jgi:ethanolamine utilization microcompartment shell protein EutS
VELSNAASPVDGEFRLYFMDRFSGHIVHVREVVATDELRAVSEALRNRWCGAVELWANGQKVMRRAPLI